MIVPDIVNAPNAVDVDPLIVFPVPDNVITPVPCVNVPPLFVQLPPIESAPVPVVRFAVLVRFPVSVTPVLLVFKAAVLPRDQFPPIDSVPDAVVFVPAPENVRF